MRAAVIVLFLSPIMTTSGFGDPGAFDGLTKGRLVHGFRAEALYLSDADRPMGARFVHARTGFTLDLLQIESVPQAFTWVQTTPVSDQGEPHTQEHLLLGKGTTGRAFAGLDTMWLASSTAFTRQRETAYHFNTSAGPEVFFRLLERQLDALLHPNYSDEEIRREVRNFGVTRNGDGPRRLEEKGTVYNEMVSSMTSSARVAYRAIQRLVYGEGHPLMLVSGGEPAGIRTMKPEDIRAFHRTHYFLANMGTIAALPQSLELRDILTRVDAALARVEPDTRDRAPQANDTLPPPRAAAPGTITYAEYPHKNEGQPSPLWFYWPATRRLPPDQFTLLELFLSTIAGDATTNLYKIFIDSRTRRTATGARSISAGVDWDGGQPVGVYLQDVAPDNFDDARIDEIRRLVTDEIQRVASFADGSPELAEFNERLSANVIQTRRNAVKFVDSPPGFGTRGTGSSWMEHMQLLGSTPGFEKSVTLKPELEFVRRQLAGTKNVWRTWLAEWQITGVTPYAVAARPQPALMEREETERTERAAAETKRLAAHYAVEDEQEALRRYELEYDAATARIEEEAGRLAPPSLVDSLPMTLDDPLRYEAKTLGGVPFVVSRFENMTSGTVGLALRLDGVSRAHLRYVALLPGLLSRVGVIEDGRPVSYEEMTQRLRREVLSLNASLSTNPRTERVELMVRGSGLGEDEMRRALRWMTLVLQSPDWRPENLPRLRDLVDQALSGLRSTMQGSEESWVQNPQMAYWRQRNPLLLASSSFLTTTHDALRLKWRLRSVDAETGAAVARFLDTLAADGKALSREALKAHLAQPERLAALPAPAREIAADAVNDLDLALIDVPDESLAADWIYLCTALRDDLLTPPAEVLAALDAIRRSLLKTGGARAFFAGSPALEKAMAPDLAALVSGLTRGDVARVTSGDVPLVDARLRERDPRAVRPVHVGLFTSAKPGGVILTSVPCAQHADHADRDKVLDLLATNIYSGSGAHSLFLKTIGAGLAYSNGVRASVGAGRLIYYAERTPELSQTVRFVIDELKKTPPEEGLADYVVAQIFVTRGSGSYEGRAEAMANDLADGQTPELVRKFREAVLALRREPDFTRRLLARKDAAYAPVLPGYATPRPEVPDACFFVIGPEKQLASWQDHLEQTEGKDARLYRLYGRDFWMP